MDALLEFFAHLTQPQAELLSSATTLLSAIIVTLFAPLVFHLLAARGMKSFNDSVADLKAAAESAKLQSAGIRRNITEIAGKVDELEVLLSSLQESVATTQNTLLESRPEEIEEEDDRIAPSRDERERVKDVWRGIRELAERAASSPAIYGQTRAKYARMDRRGYLKFLETMHADGNLPGDLSLWRQAYSAYSRAVHGGTVLPIDLQTISELAVPLQKAAAEHAEAAALAKVEAAKRKHGSNVVPFPPNAEERAA